MKQANEFVLTHHRHHSKVRGCKFCVGVVDEANILRGVAVVGRPISRHLDNGRTAEVTRLCTDGYTNACSFLYAACARTAKSMGYEKIITYTLEDEGGASLKASGWLCGGLCGGGNWNVSSRPRRDSRNTDKKLMYYKNLK
jgi:hypothetical protein